jgi:hypothetical protein
MKLKEVNYYGFNHQAVDQKFGGELEFICEMPVPLHTKSGPIPIPCAVYKAHNPDRTKGHKDYLLIFSQGETYMVTGKTEEDMSKLWNVPGILCKSCGEVLISIDRHHFNKCGCQNETFVDGGMYYQRIGAVDMSQIEDVIVNLRTKEIKHLTQRL